MGLLPASRPPRMTAGPAARFALLIVPFWRGKIKIPNEDPFAGSTEIPRNVINVTLIHICVQNNLKYTSNILSFMFKSIINYHAEATKHINITSFSALPRHEVAFIDNIQPRYGRCSRVCRFDESSRGGATGLKLN